MCVCSLQSISSGVVAGRYKEADMEGGIYDHPKPDKQAETAHHGRIINDIVLRYMSNIMREILCEGV